MNSAKKIDAAPGLRIVARHGVGYDLIDIPGMTQRGVVVTITPEANAGSVAEHTLMLMLACARRTVQYDARVRDLETERDAELARLEQLRTAARISG